MKMAENGVLTKSHGSTVRFTPPLIITREQVDEGLEKIIKSFKEL